MTKKSKRKTKIIRLSQLQTPLIWHEKEVLVDTVLNHLAKGTYLIRHHFKLKCSPAWFKKYSKQKPSPFFIRVVHFHSFGVWSRVTEESSWRNADRDRHSLFADTQSRHEDILCARGQQQITSNSFHDSPLVTLWSWSTKSRGRKRKEKLITP